MPDPVKITQINGGALSTPTKDDFIVYVDAPGGSPATRVSTAGTLFAGVVYDLTAGTAVADDLVLFVRPNGGTPVAYAGSASAFISGTAYISGTATTDWGFTYLIGDGVNVVTAKEYPGVEVPFACTIEQIMLHSGTVNGNGTIDIWKKAGTALPAGTANSICGTATKPALAGTNVYTNATLTGYTTSISKGDWIVPYVTGAGTVTSISMAIRGSKPIAS